MSSERITSSRRLAIIIVLSTLGGIASIPIGYAGRLVSSVPGFPFASSQVLAGLHVFWIIVAAMITRWKLSGTLTGILKGSVEVLLTSHLGILVLLVSSIEGLIVDLVLAASKRTSRFTIYMASGLSSASNVAVLQLILIPSFSATVYVTMYLLSFLSGLFLGGFPANRTQKILPLFSEQIVIEKEPNG